MELNLISRLTGRMILGLFLMVVGILALLDNLYVIELGSLWRFWPLIIVVLGLNKLINTATVRERGEGIWWIFLGLWLFVSIYHVFGLGFRDTWPMLLIAWGISMLYRSVAYQSHYHFARENHHGN